jgi:putative SOS response-associated peptidase YedK
MCGRFTLRSSDEAVAEAFGLADVPDLLARFNIAPGQPVAVVRQKQQAQGRGLAFLRWGLVPAWADDPSVGHRLANARSETAAMKPSFRRAFRSSRCLVVADGFYAVPWVAAILAGERRGVERGQSDAYVYRRAASTVASISSGSTGFW